MRRGDERRRIGVSVDSALVRDNLAEDFHSQMLSGTVDWLTSTVEVLKTHIARQAKRQT